MAKISTEGVINWIRLKTQSGSPTAPASGYDYLYTKSDGLYFQNSSGSIVGPLNKQPDYICIQDQKTANTGGGTFTSGSWYARDLNSEVSDIGNHASVANNQITLDAGTYRCYIICPSFEVKRNKARLQNITDGSTILLGTCGFTVPGYSDISCSFIVGQFIIHDTKVLEVQHRCESTRASVGFGVESNFGDTEIYTTAEFWKIA